jgi:hypothetical protein
LTLEAAGGARCEPRGAPALEHQARSSRPGRPRSGWSLEDFVGQLWLSRAADHAQRRENSRADRSTTSPLRGPRRGLGRRACRGSSRSRDGCEPADHRRSPLARLGGATSRPALTSSTTATCCSSRRVHRLRAVEGPVPGVEDPARHRDPARAVRLVDRLKPAPVHARRATAHRVITGPLRVPVRSSSPGSTSTRARRSSSRSSRATGITERPLGAEEPLECAVGRAAHIANRLLKRVLDYASPGRRHRHPQVAQQALALFESTSSASTKVDREILRALRDLRRATGGPRHPRGVTFAEGTRHPRRRLQTLFTCSRRGLLSAPPASRRGGLRPPRPGPPASRPVEPGLFG